MPLSLLDLITEAKVDNLVEKYPQFEEYIRKLNDELPHVKYLDWSVRIISRVAEIEPSLIHHMMNLFIDNIIENVVIFDDLLKRNIVKGADRDINSYKTFKDFYNKVQELKSAKSKTQKKREIRNDATVIYEDDNFIVINPLSTEASCQYGKGTRWCIAAKHDNYFVSYSSNDYHFYFILTKDPDNLPPGKDSDLVKIAYAIPGDKSSDRRLAIFNAPDYEITESDVRKYLEDDLYEKIVENTIKPHVEASDSTLYYKILTTKDNNFISQNFNKIKDDRAMISKLLHRDADLPEDILEKIYHGNLYRKFQDIKRLFMKRKDVSPDLLNSMFSSIVEESMTQDLEGYGQEFLQSISNNPSIDPGLLNKTTNEILKERNKENSKINMYSALIFLRSIARNSSLSRETIDAISRGGEDSWMLESAAANTSISPETIQFLIDKFGISSDVGANAISNPSLPPEAMMKIYKELTAGSRLMRGLAKNPNTPSEIIEDIIQKRSENLDAAYYALQSPNVSSETMSNIIDTSLVVDGRHNFLKGIAERSVPTDSELFEKILEIAINPKTSVGTREQLQYSLGTNPTMPANIVRQIIKTVRAGGQDYYYIADDAESNLRRRDIEIEEQEEGTNEAIIRKMIRSNLEYLSSKNLL